MLSRDLSLWNERIGSCFNGRAAISSWNLGVILRDLEILSTTPTSSNLCSQSFREYNNSTNPHLARTNSFICLQNFPERIQRSEWLSSVSCPQVKQCQNINIQSFLSKQYKICFLCSVLYMKYLLQFWYSKAISSRMIHETVKFTSINLESSTWTMTIELVTKLQITTFSSF